MRKLTWLVILILVMLGLDAAGGGAPVRAQATLPPSIFIQSPREGQALQGVEIIEGKFRGEGFRGGRVQFSYAGSEARGRTWFYIADVDPADQESSQTSFRIEWDTSQLTDGNYDLRFLAQYEGGSAIFETISNLRIRNYSPVETATPGPSPIVTQEEGETTPSLTPEPPRSPTPLPPNPVVVERGQLFHTLEISGIVVAGSFFLGMMYWYLRNKLG